MSDKKLEISDADLASSIKDPYDDVEQEDCENPNEWKLVSKPTGLKPSSKEASKSKQKRTSPNANDLLLNSFQIDAKINDDFNREKINHIKCLLENKTKKILVILRGLPGSGKSTLAK